MSAEVHIIGEIESANGFSCNRLFCKWNLEFGGGWNVIDGRSKGETQTDLAELDNCAYFAHPIDVRLSTKTVQGWPSIKLEIWCVDEFGRQNIYGYGSTYVPISSGEHQVVCHIWRPKGDLREELMQYFIGGGMQLNTTLMGSFNQMNKITTVSLGVVELRLCIVTRYFDRFGIVS